MAKIWRNRIIAGTKHFADCPERYKDEVLVLLRAEVEKGNLTPEMFEELTGEPFGEN